MKETRISIVVQGRFHAFALAKAMIEQGSPVQVLTNYPAFIAERFGIPAANMKGIASLGLLHRYANRWGLTDRIPALNQFLHQSFSLWASRHIPHTEPVAVHVFSGVALELFHQLRMFNNPVTRLLLRGSGHIVDQYHDLSREARRAGSDIEKPSPWMIHRERQEYAMADHIITLSSFARKTFLKRGYSDEKTMLLPLGSNVEQFRPPEQVIAARRQRIRSGQKLTVLYTGNVSLQKGVIDLIEVAQALRDRFHFRVVGNVTADAAARIRAAGDALELVPRQPEAELPAIYNAADIYLFPTLHDGFAAVLAQAQAGCLPILATDHCAAPDMVKEGVTGWTLPVCRADLFIDRLRWCDTHRESLAGMVDELWLTHENRDWSAVAADFLGLVHQAVALRQARHTWET